MKHTTIQNGWLSGSKIVRAKKADTCDYFRGKAGGGYCRRPIKPGDYYVQAPPDVRLYGSPWACDKYCLPCAGVEAEQAASTLFEF